MTETEQMGSASVSRTILLGYDIESASENTGGLLERASDLHERHQVRWSIYLTGRTVEERTDDIRKALAGPLLTSGHTQLR